MTSVLLSCQCKRMYDPPPYAGDLVTCPTHGVATVLGGKLLLTCDDCSYRKEYSALAKISICTFATKHAITAHHRVSHQIGLDSSDRMCLHDHRMAPEFTFGKPPF